MSSNDEILLAPLDDSQREILAAAPTPQDGKVGDLRTAVSHKGSMYLAMKTGINQWEYSFPFARGPQIRHFHRGEDISGGAITGPIDYIDFVDDFEEPAYREGRWFYDKVNKCFTFFNDEPGVSHQVGQENWLPVRDESGGTINDGDVVYISGASQGMPTIEKAKADSPITADRTIGVATHDIEDNTDGYVTTFGKVRGLDTSAFGAGEVLYIDASVAGGLTNVQPIYPNFIIKVGTCVTSDANIGEVTINVSGRIEDILENGWNGGFLETIDFTVTSAVGTVTGSLERDGGGELTMNFSDGFTILDTDPALTIVLTPGTDAVPQDNFVYIPIATKVLTLSTSDWPTTEHIKVSKIVLRTAATTATDGALGNRNWNDHVAGGTGAQGHIQHIAERIRQDHAVWHSGTLGSATIIQGPTPSDVYIAATSGSVYQLHKQTFPALNMQTGDDIHVVNDSVAAYKTLTNLGGQNLDANGVSLANKSFSFVSWGVMNRTGEQSHLMLNLPVGSYAKNNPTSAVSDAFNFSVYDIPAQFKGVGFLIARFTFVLDAAGQVWTLHDTQDLRGFSPNATAGGGAGGGAGTEFSDSQFAVLNNADITKRVELDVSGVTTVTTRTLGIPDVSGTLPVGTGAANHVAIWSGANTLVHAANQLYWDIANNRLGVLNPSPGASLHVGQAGDTSSRQIRVESGTGTPSYSVIRGGGTVILFRGDANTSYINTGGSLAIGNTAASASAILDLQSTTRALIVTRMTATQRNALTAVNGMVIYNSTTNAFNFYENGAWVSGSGLA